MTKLERLLAKVTMPDGCWLWTGAQGNKGYGRIRTGPRVGSTVQLAHRAMWEAVHGPIVGDADVCHHCDNPLCVRPDHLYLGSPATNAHDRDVRGRTKTKLTAADVILIRMAYDDAGFRITDLAGHFGVSVSTVHAIVHRRAWKHVP